jgi:hypothetical protein
MSVNDNVIRFGLFPNSLIVLNLFDCERGELEGFVARRRKLQLSDLMYVPVPTTAHSSHPQTIGRWRLTADSSEMAVSS